MYHKPDIWLINTHSEGNSSHHHVNFFHQEIVLGFGTQVSFKPSMVRCGFYAVYVQQLGYLFGAFAAKDVNNTRLACISLYKLHYGPIVGGFYTFWAYLII